MELDKQALDRWLTNSDREEIDLSGLSDDGDTIELEDGRILRLRVMPDDTDPFAEYDCYGMVAPVDHRSQQGSRPDGFTGNAEKMWLQQNGGCIWWEPPKDGPKRGTPEFATFKQNVNDLASFGMVIFVLELCEGIDAYHRPIVVQSASLGGIEPFPDDSYKAEVIGDLAEELEV